MIYHLTKIVIAADFGFGEKHRVGDNCGVDQMVAMTYEVFEQSRLIAFRRSIAPEPALLHMGGINHQGIPDKSAGRKSAESVRRPSRRMRTAVHPDHAM